MPLPFTLSTRVSAVVTIVNCHQLTLLTCKKKWVASYGAIPLDFKTFSLTLLMLTQNTQLSFRLTNCAWQLSISSSVCSLNFDNTHIGVRSEPLVLWISKLKCYLSGSHHNRRLVFTGGETLTNQQHQTTRLVQAPVPQRRLQLLC